MHNLSSEELRILDEIAGRHEVSLDAVVVLYRALGEGEGRQAQFNHPDLGGMGQWSQGGMVMIGDMFNQGLKHRVDLLCTELASLVRNHHSLRPEERVFQSQGQGSSGGSRWWPADFGGAASTGAQNDLRYAYFPTQRRLVIQQGGLVQVYDTGDHQISGFSQQQGGDQSLTFMSQFGVVRAADLPLIAGEIQEPDVNIVAAASAGAPAAAQHVSPRPIDDIVATIERLADLRRKEILTEEEFAAKKAELLGRI
jgi:hypothetical protein